MIEPTDRKAIKRPEPAGPGQFVRLRDGRVIYEPGKGGVYSKGEIREALIAARRLRIGESAG